MLNTLSVIGLGYIGLPTATLLASRKKRVVGVEMICDQLDINIWELIKLTNRHPRVNILQPGCGVGGHCIAVDPWFIVNSAPEHSQLIRAARIVNEAKPEWVLSKVNQAIAKLTGAGIAISEINIACLGITYKPDIDDLRNSPALRITATLAKHHSGEVAVVEPNLPNLPNDLVGARVAQMTFDEASAWAHILVLLVDHAEFKKLNPELKSGQILIDTRGIWKDTK